MFREKDVMMEVKAVCDSCGGTGLYVGMCEPKDTAVVCVRCGGTGCLTIRYKPFIHRSGKRGIHTVSLSRGSFILACGAKGKSISYAEFEAGKMPTE
jgi:DnaJ-class molecular chaperone